MKRSRSISVRLLIPSLLCGIIAAHNARPLLGGDSAAGKAIEFFELQVQPILAQHCHNCHSADNKAAGGLRVDDHHGLLVGGDRGAAVVPGNPDDSWLIKAIMHADADLKMPPDSRLTEAEIEILRLWIENGAAWPAVEMPANILQSPADYEPLIAGHWAWQPLSSSSPPELDGGWARDDIDRFVLQKLNDSGLRPTRDAEKRELIRRLTFDLTGLPPTIPEIEAFLTDTSPQAVDVVVDRLLSTTAYGEKWGRHWLDVARYAESTGSSRNLPYPHAWRYRDYVVHSLNNDKPYDQFLQEQIAGDLLPAETPAEETEHQIATGFLALGVKDVNQRFPIRYRMDNVDEQIDTVTRSVLALTVSCARCHDHKFDPIPTADYYALAGIFASTELQDGLRSQMGGSGLAYYVPERLIALGEPSEPDKELQVKIEEARQAVRASREAFVALRDDVREGQGDAVGRQKKVQASRRKWQKRQAELLALTDPAAHGPVALGVRDSTAVADTAIRLRGEAERLGPVVPRGVLSLLQIPNAPAINRAQSGRLELAQWLTARDNPLTQRVIVNRVWKHLFGEGLVESVDNFGSTGTKPSHPELLDHLAADFVDNGWSLKSLIRKIVLSRTYQLSSTFAVFRRLEPAVVRVV